MTEGSRARKYSFQRPEFRVGSVLNRSISIWFKNLVPFTLLAIIFQSPVLIYAYVKMAEIPWSKADRETSPPSPAPRSGCG